MTTKPKQRGGARNGTPRFFGATERALQRIKDGETAYRAAKNEGIALSTIYRAIKKLKLFHGS